MLQIRDRVAPTLKLMMPRYDDGIKKRLDLLPISIPIWVLPLLIYHLLYYDIHCWRQPHIRLLWPREARNCPV